MDTLIERHRSIVKNIHSGHTFQTNHAAIFFKWKSVLGKITAYHKYLIALELAQSPRKSAPSYCLLFCTFHFCRNAANLTFMTTDIPIVARFRQTVDVQVYRVSSDHGKETADEHGVSGTLFQALHFVCVLNVSLLKACNYLTPTAQEE